MNTFFRTVCAVLALTTAGLAQASEITEFALEKSTLSRAEVQATARTVRSTQPSALYDGSQLANQVMPATMKSREQVRMEARVGTLDRQMQNDRVGGM